MLIILISLISLSLNGQITKFKDTLYWPLDTSITFYYRIDTDYYFGGGVLKTTPGNIYTLPYIVENPTYYDVPNFTQENKYWYLDKGRTKISKSGTEILLLYSTSILLNAVGDALNDEGDKFNGHLCNAGSIALLLATPLLVDLDRTKWYWYLATYTSLRIGMFDFAYNKTRGLPLNYVGTSSATDRMWRYIGNPALMKVNFIIFGAIIPLSKL